MPPTLPEYPLPRDLANQILDTLQYTCVNDNVTSCAYRIVPDDLNAKAAVDKIVRDDTLGDDQKSKAIADVIRTTKLYTSDLASRYTLDKIFNESQSYAPAVRVKLLATLGTDISSGKVWT